MKMQKFTDDQLISMWDELLIDDEPVDGILIDDILYSDEEIHAELNRRGLGKHCAV